MKFGKLLKLNTLPEWKDFYFDYKGLKGELMLPCATAE
jgi:SPX domain protein involved in polyphosphate accumulation